MSFNVGDVVVDTSSGIIGEVIGKDGDFIIVLCNKKIFKKRDVFLLNAFGIKITDRVADANKNKQLSLGHVFNWKLAINEEE